MDKRNINVTIEQLLKPRPISLFQAGNLISSDTVIYPSQDIKSIKTWHDNNILAFETYDENYEFFRNWEYTASIMKMVSGNLLVLIIEADLNFHPEYRNTLDRYLSAIGMEIQTGFRHARYFVNKVLFTNKRYKLWNYSGYFNNELIEAV